MNRPCARHQDDSSESAREGGFSALFEKNERHAAGRQDSEGRHERAANRPVKSNGSRVERRGNGEQIEQYRPPELVLHGTQHGDDEDHAGKFQRR